MQVERKRNQENSEKTRNTYESASRMYLIFLNGQKGGFETSEFQNFKMGWGEVPATIVVEGFRMGKVLGEDQNLINRQNGDSLKGEKISPLKKRVRACVKGRVPLESVLKSRSGILSGKGTISKSRRSLKKEKGITTQGNPWGWGGKGGSKAGEWRRG